MIFPLIPAGGGRDYKYAARITGLPNFACVPSEKTRWPISVLRCGMEDQTFI